MKNLYPKRVQRFQKLFTIFLTLISIAAFSQEGGVSIGPTAGPADPSAAFDVQYNNKGMLVPRMSTVQRLAVSNPANSLLVFDTDSNSFYYYKVNTWVAINEAGQPGATGPTGAQGITGPTGPLGTAGGDLNGNYPNPAVTHIQGDSVSSASPSIGQILIWNGTAYVPVTIDTVTSDKWLIAGNIGTNPSNNFLGTADNTDLVFRTNNIETARITASGRMAIGVSSPATSAMLDVQSNNSGFLFPRMTMAERNAIANPAAGLMIFDSTDNCVEIYGLGQWQPISCLCTGAPSIPSTIAGNSNPCPNATSINYSIGAAFGAISYTWSVPSDATVTTGQGTTAITVNFGVNPGNVSIVANNSCGSSNASTLPITYITPSTPGSISGANSVCPNATGIIYSISSVSGTSSYNWTVPSGASITANSGTSITVSFGANPTGNIAVSTTNNCGATGGQSTLSISQSAVCSPLTFSYTGSKQTFTVPSGVTTLSITAYGAQGGNAGANTGGLGGSATGQLTVTGGEIIYIYVGGQPIHTDSVQGGFNGGGNASSTYPYPGAGGGGASDVRAGLGDTALSYRVIVAGGGGGAGASSPFGSPQNGGSGGGTNGGNGSSSYGPGYYGSGGTQSAGGAAATSGGTQGSLGQGGSETAAGGGGGGGYWGGGAGYIGGGGGGSGYTGGVTNASMQTGVQSGNGQVIITW